MHCNWANTSLAAGYRLWDCRYPSVRVQFSGSALLQNSNWQPPPVLPRDGGRWQESETRCAVFELLSKPEAGFQIIWISTSDWFSTNWKFPSEIGVPETGRAEVVHDFLLCTSCTNYIRVLTEYVCKYVCAPWYVTTYPTGKIFCRNNFCRENFLRGNIFAVPTFLRFFPSGVGGEGGNHLQ